MAIHLRTHSRRARGLAGVALAVALLSGCGGPATSAPTAPAADGPAVVAPAASVGALSEARPTRLLIPSIDVDSTTMMDLGLNPDRSLEVPPDGATAGWYTGSPTPGELGPSVIAAHVDWNGEEGVFYDLREMEPGDELTVERADGSTARFEVLRVEQYPKDEFPTSEVYGDVDTPQLRLITCGGEFDDEARSYRDNVVVYAGFVGTA
ncbi:class F sortase [Pseudonocardia nigra]|uniref:class F sortase n=1 Tax=Pseudonocardia nigra TaxID=1921578 RepID=UPI001C5E733C|nr:class F sortase [Pseudonocardia nigra]